MLSPSELPPDAAPSLVGRLGRFLIVIGAIAGVAMAVAEPSGQGANPGPVITTFGLVLLGIAWLSGRRQGPHHPQDKAPCSAGRQGKFLIVIGAIAGAAMAVAEPSGQGANPGPVIITLGFVLLVVAWLGGRRQETHHQVDKAPHRQSRPQ